MRKLRHKKKLAQGHICSECCSWIQTQSGKVSLIIVLSLGLGLTAHRQENNYDLNKVEVYFSPK